MNVPKKRRKIDAPSNGPPMSAIAARRARIEAKTEHPGPSVDTKTPHPKPMLAEVAEVSPSGPGSSISQNLGNITHPSVRTNTLDQRRALKINDGQGDLDTELSELKNFKELKNGDLLIRLAPGEGNMKCVAILDLDPGQPEFSLPGQLSLIHLREPNFGPPFSHPRASKKSNIIRSHAIAAVSPSMDPNLYTACAIDLYTHYRILVQKFPECPLIINTPGWVLGTGLEILVELISKIHPTEVIYMSEDGPREVVDSLKESAGSTPVYTLPSQATIPGWKTKEEDVPKAQAQAQDNGGMGDENYVAFEDHSEIGLFDVDELHPISLTEPLIIRTQAEKLPYFNPENAISLNPRYSQALGLALIRGIDVPRRKLQILTSIEPSVVEEINRMGKNIVLISGKLDTPGWAYTEELVQREVIAKQNGDEATTDDFDKDREEMYSP
ncbi:putative Polynucleotide 5'-hydroxyl-kinase grc3 [Glarea lozoyensis 74030]|uniref:Polynucleotide 5'-hydroxyl-kinase GRC3 n=1 Tax=Glarea lozoyensis (strain ATCC 74030 / MF5533) TaxID=1104152 RepID=H0EFL7_GLAL7|nr:putative Polynucleotide 5'-hydroxyl-kinase grc3 [Glarea lozoyensis 74030]